MFVDGLSQLIGFDVVGGEIYETPDADESDVELTQTSVVRTVSEWVNAMPPVDGTVRDGDMEYA